MKKQENTKAHGILNPLSGQLVKRLFSIQETAHYLGRSEWAIRELEWKGELPAIRVGRRVHFDINDLDDFIEKNKSRNTY